MNAKIPFLKGYLLNKMLTLIIINLYCIVVLLAEMLASKCSYSSPLIFFIKKLPKKWSNNGPKGIIFLRIADPYIFCKKYVHLLYRKGTAKEKLSKKFTTILGFGYGSVPADSVPTVQS